MIVQISEVPLAPVQIATKCILYCSYFTSDRFDTCCILIDCCLICSSAASFRTTPPRVEDRASTELLRPPTAAAPKPTSDPCWVRYQTCPLGVSTETRGSFIYYLNLISHQMLFLFLIDCLLIEDLTLNNSNL